MRTKGSYTLQIPLLCELFRYSENKQFFPLLLNYANLSNFHSAICRCSWCSCGSWL